MLNESVAFFSIEHPDAALLATDQVTFEVQLDPGLVVSGAVSATYPVVLRVKPSGVSGTVM